MSENRRASEPRGGAGSATLPSLRTHYGPGPGTILAGPRVAAIIDVPPDHHAARALEPLVRPGAPLEAMATALAADGIGKLPSLAITRLDDDGSAVRLLVRGSASVTIRCTDGEELHPDGSGHRTWLETRVDDVESVTVHLGEPAPTAFAMVSGSAPGGSMTLALEADDEGPDPSPMPEPPYGNAEVDADVGVPAVTGGDEEDADAPGRADDTPADPADALDDMGPEEVQSVDPQPRTGDDERPGEPGTATGGDDEVVGGGDGAPADGARPAAPVPPTTVTFDFGHLLDETRHVGVEEAAVRVDDDGPGDQIPLPEHGEGRRDPASAPFGAPAAPGPEATGSDETLTYTGETPAPPATAGTPPAPITAGTPPTPAAGLISAVPGMAVPGTASPGPTGPGPAGVPPTPASAPAPPASPSTRGTGAGARPSAPFRDWAPVNHGGHPVGPVDEEEAGHTRARSAGSGTGASGTGTRVQAVHCPAGHPNPPYANQCRRCRVTITDRAVTDIARPSLGQLVDGKGNRHELDRDLVIGRTPPSTPVVEGRPARAVTIQDPEALISRLHAEVRLVDWQVQVVDRDSMNHTFVELPGRPPMQLRPAEPCPIPPGSVVDLGGAARFTFVVGES